MAAPDSELPALSAFANELADAARAVILPYFRADHRVSDKYAPGHRDPDQFDPVTEADKAAEQAMRALIAQRYPHHGVLGEEFGAERTGADFTWIIDPIDGTRAFIAGLPLWGVLIGLAHQGRPILGVIDQPYIGERFLGWSSAAGQGATLTTRDGARPLQASACARLADAKLATTDERLFTGTDATAFAKVRSAAKLTRYGCDCYAYAMVAMGGIDCVIENGLRPWDVAALIPVIEGAGGTLTNWRGAPLHAGDQLLSSDTRLNSLACGDARVRDAAIALLGGDPR